MQLDTLVEEWNHFYDKLLTNTIALTAVGYERCFNKDFPEDIIAAGDNWYSLMHIGEESISDRYSVMNEGSIKMDQVNIKAVNRVITNNTYIPMTSILRGNREMLKSPEIAVFTFSEFQENDLKDWGIVDKFNDYLR